MAIIENSIKMVESVIRKLRWVNKSPNVTLPKYAIRRMGLEGEKDVELKINIFKNSFQIIPLSKRGKAKLKETKKKDKQIAEIIWAMNKYEHIRAMINDLVKSEA